ncbi:hypothetical protein YC2023_033666 [Brassica napus]
MVSVNAKGDSKSTAQTLLSFLRIPAIELCRESASSRRRRMSSATHQLVVRMIQRLLQFDIASESSVLSGVTFGSSNEGLPLLESSVYHCCWACVFHSHGPSLSGCPLSKIGYSSDGSQKLLGQRCVEIGPSSSI